MLKRPTVFTQTLHDMCLDIKMACLYKHLVLHGSPLWSSYWKEACAMYDYKNDYTSTWNSSAIIRTMKIYENTVFSRKAKVAARDVFVPTSIEA